MRENPFERKIGDVVIRICDDNEREVCFDGNHISWIPLSKAVKRGPNVIYQALQNAGYIGLPTLEEFKNGFEKTLKEYYSKP